MIKRAEADSGERGVRVRRGKRRGKKREVGRVLEARSRGVEVVMGIGEAVQPT